MEIIKHVSLETVESYIDNPELCFQNLTKVEKERLQERFRFIRLRYLGYTVAESATILGVNRQSCYNWQKSWNEKGCDALRPGFDGGAPSKLNAEQKKNLASYVSGREMCTDAVVEYVSEAYGVNYSGMQISRILKNEGLVYRRGYKIDHRRPQDPVAVLKKTSEWHWMLPEPTT